MELISNVRFCDESVILDGKHFRDCNFDSCELLYNGGAVVFERVGFTACDPMFAGQAARTVDVLKVMGLLGVPSSTEPSSQWVN